MLQRQLRRIFFFEKNKNVTFYKASANIEFTETIIIHSGGLILGDLLTNKQQKERKNGRRKKNDGLKAMRGFSLSLFPFFSLYLDFFFKYIFPFSPAPKISKKNAFFGKKSKNPKHGESQPIFSFFFSPLFCHLTPEMFQTKQKRWSDPHTTKKNLNGILFHLLPKFFFISDVNHEMDCRTAWLGVSTPRYSRSLYPKVHCSREGLVFFQLYFF